MPTENLLAGKTRRFLQAVVSGLFLLAAASGHGSGVLAAPAERTSPASAPPPSASVVRATQAVDTYRINAGKAQGYEAGDRVNIVRAGAPVAPATVLRVEATWAEIVVRSSPAPRLRPGDTVEFVHHRPPLVDASPRQGAGAPSPARPTASSSGPDSAPTDWREVGQAPGVLGSDWMTRSTRHCRIMARKQDLAYVNGIVAGLDDSYEANRTFMGIDLDRPIEFWFFSMAEPAHVQPRFAQRLARYTRAAGVALRDLNTCVINEGSQRTSTHYNPWTLEETCRHEMNHIFAYRGIPVDRLHTKEWFLEALAHTIEDTVRPASTRLDQASLRSYMAGYRAADASFAALIQDRNNDDLEQYRTYNRILVSVIFFLQGKYGSDAIARIVRLTSRGMDLEDAFSQVCGKGIRSLEVEWREYYGIH